MAPSPSKYRVGVKTANDPEWVYNSLTFDTTEAAKAYAQDLASRWTAVTEWYIETCIEEED